MAVVHENFQRLALRLITKNGRTVQLKKTTRVAADEVNEPWKKGASNATVTTQLTSAPACFFDASDVVRIDDLVVRLSQATGNADRTTIHAERTEAWIPALSDTLVDGDVEWEIRNVKLIQPGPTPIVYIVEIGR